MELENICDVRALLLVSRGPAMQLLRNVLTIAGVTKIVIVEDSRRAIELLSSEYFHCVFVEGATDHEGMPFAVAARRLPMLLNPMIPIFALFHQARKRDVETARDLGVHDVICRPVSPKTIQSKLLAAIRAPRPFIAAPGFFGPDRRAKSRAAYAPAADRRRRTPKKAKVSFVEV